MPCHAIVIVYNNVIVCTCAIVIVMGIDMGVGDGLIPLLMALVLLVVVLLLTPIGTMDVLTLARVRKSTVKSTALPFSALGVCVCERVRGCMCV